jgi:hypothetical protein
VPTENQRFPMRYGPSADQGSRFLSRISAYHGTASKVEQESGTIVL